MIQLEVVQKPGMLPTNMSSVAAKACYSAGLPPLNSKMNVKGQLFDTGHHTTLQHSSYTFVIWDIAVGDVTFGLHLCSPFYNTDQRSGRYCSAMFEDPDYVAIARYIRSQWPSYPDRAFWAFIAPYLMYGFDLYDKYREQTIELAEAAIRRSRPNFPQKNIAEQASKVAQEQRRVFVPIISPTALYYTADLSAIVALYKSAFTPGMRLLTSMMADEVISHDSDTAFMFERPDLTNWYPNLWEHNEVEVKVQPECTLLSIDNDEYYTPVPDSWKHPVDLMHFRPEVMSNSIGDIKTLKQLSVMTMGQDQRHRTVKRSQPVFTKYFYLPPLLARCKGARKDAMRLINMWLELREKVPKTMATILAPYGAMVSYISAGDFTAIEHEQDKRLCWNAQEEIRNLSRQLREQVIELKGNDHDMVRMFEPACYRGKCQEGARYCGRPLKARRNERYFARQVI